MGNFGLISILARGDPYRAEWWGSGLYPPRLVGFASYALGYAQVALIGLLFAFWLLGNSPLSGFSHTKALGA